jgi:hypothetical protein
MRHVVHHLEYLVPSSMLAMADEYRRVDAATE